MRMWRRLRATAAITTEGSLGRAHIEQPTRSVRPPAPDPLAAAGQKFSAHTGWKRRRARPSGARTLHRAIIAREAACDAGAEVMLLTNIGVPRVRGRCLVRIVMKSMELQEHVEYHDSKKVRTPGAAAKCNQLSTRRAQS